MILIMTFHMAGNGLRTIGHVFGEGSPQNQVFSELLS